jgi:transposase
MVPIKLTAKERRTLRALVSDGKAAHEKIVRARVLLLADASSQGPAQRDRQISENLGVSMSMVWNLRQRVAERGVLDGLEHRNLRKSGILVKLTARERRRLRDLVSDGTAGHQKTVRARVLLLADASSQGPAQRDWQISEALGVGMGTVWSLRRRFAERGLRGVLERKKSHRRSSSASQSLAKVLRPHVIALRRSDPPEGAKRWSLRLLAKRLVELKIVPKVSHESVRIALGRPKKPATDRKRSRAVFERDFSAC